MFVLHGQEDEREMDKENREVEAKVERTGLQELEKKLERAAPPRQQTKLSSTLQVIFDGQFYMSNVPVLTITLPEPGELHTGQH